MADFRVGFIGLGAMGGHMARHLAQAGWLKAVYNRSPAKALALADEFPVQVCDNPAQLAEQVDVVLLCVSADQDVLAMVDALLPELAAGSVVIDTSTVSSETAQIAAQRLAQQQVAFLDAPVSGGVEGARLAKLAMMVGGEADVLARVQPVLQCLAARIEHMGATGNGQACKAVNQIMAAGINQAVTEALAFGAVQGLDMDKVIDVIAGGAAGNWFLQHRGKTMTQGSFQPGFKLALHHKDLRICQAMAQRVDMATPLVDATLDAYAQLMQQGFGDEDISALYRLKRKQPN